MRELTFPISWHHGPQYAYVYTTKEKGFFEQEGLKVNIVEHIGSEVTNKRIGRGEYPIGMVGAEAAMIARSNGTPLRTVAVADKVNPSGITFHKDAGIAKPKDLEGKKIGVTLGSNAYQQYLAFCRKERVDREKIKEVTISGTGSEWVEHEVDGHVLYPYLSEALAESKDLEVDSLLFYDYGLETYGQILAANIDTIENDPELIRKVTRAIVKGLQYERMNPQEALEFSFQQNPQIKQEENYHKKVFKKRLNLDNKLEDTKEAGNGLQDRHTWSYTKDLLDSLDLLSSDVNIGEFFTNKFIKDIEEKGKSPSLLLRRVSKSFPQNKNELPVLKDINIEVNEGEYVTILGSSGCGKTTLLRIMSGLEQDYQGKVLSDGKPLAQEQRKKFSYMMQQESLLPWKTVEQNVVFFAENLGRSVNPQEIIREVGLEGFEDHYPNELSGGMKKRVALARALLTKPYILFMDEPFGSLDTITRWDMNNLVMRLCRKHLITTVMVTHNIEEAVYLSDKVMLLKGAPARIKQVYQIPFERPRDEEVITRDRYNEIVKKIREDFK